MFTFFRTTISGDIVLTVSQTEGELSGSMVLDGTITLELPDYGNYTEDWGGTVDFAGMIEEGRDPDVSITIELDCPLDTPPQVLEFLGRHDSVQGRIVATTIIRNCPVNEENMEIPLTIQADRTRRRQE